MKLTPEQLAEWKALVTKLIDDSSDHMGVAHSTDMPPQHTVNFRHAKNAHEAAWAITNLIANLEEEQRELKNERARGIHSCRDNCTRDGCVNRRLREELNTTRKQLAEAQAKLAHLAKYWNRDENEIAMKDACWHTVEVAEASDTSALAAAISAIIEPYKRNAERYCWLRENCLRAVTIAADAIAITDSTIDAAIAAKVGCK